MIELPIKTVGGLNAREHYRARAKRVKTERTEAAFAVRVSRHKPLPCKVLLTRISPGTLDDDNLQGALKAIRDGVADALGIDDRDPRVSWRYAQAKAGKGVYAVRIEVEAV